MSKNNHGKRMVPEYLIAKLETIEPGSEYTAGNGIDITDSEISIDDTVVATKTDLSAYQTTSNLVTSLSSASTDTQYPSAKCVYDIVGDIESLLAAI